MDIGAAITTVTASIGIAKEISALVKAANKVEALEKLVDLREQLVDAKQAMLDLREENHGLKAALERREALTFDGKVYWMGDGEGREGPFCQRCRDGDGRLVRLQAGNKAGRVTGGGIIQTPIWRCLHCKSRVATT